MANRDIQNEDQNQPTLITEALVTDKQTMGGDTQFIKHALLSHDQFELEKSGIKDRSIDNDNTNFNDSTSHMRKTGYSTAEFPLEMKKTTRTIETKKSSKN